MAIPLDLAQQVLSLLNDAAIGSGGHNPTGNGTQTIPQSSQRTVTALPSAFDITSIITFILSFAALRDWLKLAFIGAVFETTRRIVLHVWYKCYNAFFITALFEDEDAAYDWMMVWLSQQPSWRAARDVQITSKSFGLNSQATGIEGEGENATDALSSTRSLAYLPAIHTTFTFWYKRRWTRINRGVRDGGGYYGHRVEMITVCIMSWDHKVLNEMLLEAKKAYKEAQENTISILTSDSSNNWRHMASRPKRPLSSIVLDPGIKDLILDDARDFLLSKSWYTARGIPFRRGYLLYGAPGTGKTSIIHSLAGELGLDVYIISLSRSSLDDNALGELISDLPEKCIALMEDIDAAFSQTLNRDAEDNDAPDPNRPNAKGGPSNKSTSKISLSGLLNALDGVGAQEGRILFATTNKYSSLDSALCRPGRMDVHIEFKLASKYQARELYMRFYLPDSELEAASADKVEIADDSGYSTGDEDGDEKSALVKKEEAPRPATSMVAPHKLRAPRLSKRQAQDLADKFAESIPDREFSMAVLQGYLMGYKVRPYEAVADAPPWVIKQRLDALAKSEKEKKEKEKKEKQEKEKKEKQEQEAKEKEKPVKVVAT